MKSRKTWWSVIAMLAIFSMVIAACQPAAAPTEPPVAETEVMTEEPAEGEMPFEGETVTIFTAAGEEQLRVFEQNFVDFEARTGIDVVGEGSPDFETLSVVRYVIRDEGPGFDRANLVDPTAPENVCVATGRGLFLIRTFMDRIEHNETGNEIILTKTAPPPGPAG